MTFIWVHYVFTIGLIFVGITGSIPCKESGKIISMTVLCYIAFAEAILCLGYCICEALVLLDVCEEYTNVLNPYTSLLNYRIGLEYYIAPLAQDAKNLLATKYLEPTITDSCKTLIEFLFNNCEVRVLAKMSQRRLCINAFDQMMILLASVVCLTIGSLIIMVMYNSMRTLIAKRNTEKKKNMDKSTLSNLTLSMI